MLKIPPEAGERGTRRPVRERGTGRKCEAFIRTYEHTHINNYFGFILKEKTLKSQLLL